MDVYVSCILAKHFHCFLKMTSEILRFLQLVKPFKTHVEVAWLPAQLVEHLSGQVGIYINLSGHRRSKTRSISAWLPSQCRDLILWIKQLRESASYQGEGPTNPAILIPRENSTAVSIGHDSCAHVTAQTNSRLCHRHGWVTYCHKYLRIIRNFKVYAGSSRDWRAERRAPEVGYARHRVPGWKNEQRLKSNTCCVCYIKCPSPGHIYLQEETPFSNARRAETSVVQVLNLNVRPRIHQVRYRHGQTFYYMD